MIFKVTLTLFLCLYGVSSKSILPDGLLSRTLRQVSFPSSGCTAVEKRTLVRKSCVFPFKYKDRIHHGCITKNDPDERLWCSTQVDINGYHVIGRDVWGHCETSEQNCAVDVDGTAIIYETIFDENGNPIDLGTRKDIIWLKFTGTLYAHNCDFKGPVIKNIFQTKANECSNICSRTQACSHYTWSPPKEGTCSLKSGGARFTQDNPIPSPNLRCGYKTNE